MANHFKDFDTDGDGMVSKAEMAAGLEKYKMTDEATTKMFYSTVGFMPANQK